CTRRRETSPRSRTSKATNARRPSTATSSMTHSIGPSISWKTARNTIGSSSFMVQLLASGATAQHADIGWLEGHGFHHPADPQLLQSCDHAGERHHQVVLLVDHYQHGTSQTRGEGAGSVALV